MDKCWRWSEVWLFEAPEWIIVYFVLIHLWKSNKLRAAGVNCGLSFNQLISVIDGGTSNCAGHSLTCSPVGTIHYALSSVSLYSAIVLPLYSCGTLHYFPPPYTINQSTHFSSALQSAERHLNSGAPLETRFNSFDRQPSPLPRTLPTQRRKSTIGWIRIHIQPMRSEYCWPECPTISASGWSPFWRDTTMSTTVCMTFRKDWRACFGWRFHGEHAAFKCLWCTINVMQISLSVLNIHVYCDTHSNPHLLFTHRTANICGISASTRSTVHSTQLTRPPPRCHALPLSRGHAPIQTATTTTAVETAAVTRPRIWLPMLTVSLAAAMAQPQPFRRLHTRFPRAKNFPSPRQLFRIPPRSHPSRIYPLPRRPTLLRMLSTRWKTPLPTGPPPTLTTPRLL